MGLFSGLHRYHGAGESANDRNIEQYGEPAYSLFTARKFKDLHPRIEITDDEGRVVYETEGKIVSIREKTDITDGEGNSVAHIEKRPFSLHEKHFITMADGREFTLSNQLFHLIKDVTDIEGLDWQLRGNVLGLNFMLFDGNDEPVAAISQKAVSIHDKYSVDIYQPNQEQVVVAIVIALTKMIAQREANMSSN